MAGVMLKATIDQYLRTRVKSCTDVEDSQDPPPQRPPEYMARLEYVLINAQAREE
jgi:hypothetical protein